MPVWMAVTLILAVVLAGVAGFVLDWHKSRTSPDQLVLEQLQKAGSNLAKVHEVEFFLVFATLEGAQAAAQELSTAGYATVAEPTGMGAEAWCEAKKPLVPELETLRQIRASLSGVAARFGGKYDGWGSPVVK